jgi:hypothetical protein
MKAVPFLLASGKPVFKTDPPPPFSWRRIFSCFGRRENGFYVPAPHRHFLETVPFHAWEENGFKAVSPPHFHDVMIVFCFVSWGLEDYLQDSTPHHFFHLS